SLPACMSAAGGFEHEQAANGCRARLESYLSAVERHANCLLSVAEEEARRRVEAGRREAARARDEGRAAAARCECRAQSGGVCFYASLSRPSKKSNPALSQRTAMPQGR